MALDERTTFKDNEIVDGEDPYIGKILASQYRIERLLGSGGWGNVYLAEHMALANKVAIKILHQHLGGTSANAIKTRSGIIYQRMRRYDDAIKEFEEGLRLRKAKGTLNSTTANHDYYNLGLCYERSGSLQKAAENYQKCMETYKTSGTEPDSYYPMFKQSYDRVSTLLPAKGERADANGK